MTDHLANARRWLSTAQGSRSFDHLMSAMDQILAHLDAQQAAQEVTTAPQTAQQPEPGHGDGDEVVRAAEDYTPQAWRLTGYYPESYARLMDILNGGILPDWDDDDHNRHEAEFRADLAAHDAEVRAQIAAEIEARQWVVASAHHFGFGEHGWTCLCGFTSPVSRQRTEHIIAEIAAARIACGTAAKEDS